MKYTKLPIQMWRWFISVAAVVIGYNSVAISERIMEIADGHPEIEQIIEEV